MEFSKFFCTITHNIKCGGILSVCLCYMDHAAGPRRKKVTVKWVFKMSCKLEFTFCSRFSSKFFRFVYFFEQPIRTQIWMFMFLSSHYYSKFFGGNSILIFASARARETGRVQADRSEKWAPKSKVNAEKGLAFVAEKDWPFAREVPKSQLLSRARVYKPGVFNFVIKPLPALERERSLFVRKKFQFFRKFFFVDTAHIRNS